MKRRRLLQAVAAAGAAGVSGCVSVRLAEPGEGGGGEKTATQTQDPLPDNYGMQLCSNDDQSVYKVSAPEFEVRESETALTGTVEYIGEDTGQFAVSPDIIITMYDEGGERIHTTVKTLRFSPKDPYEYGLTVNARDTSEWDQVTAMTVELRDQTDGDEGQDACLADEFADPQSDGA